MATDKNITMKQYNGTDYDSLYPATKSSQIIDTIPLLTKTSDTLTINRGGTGSTTAANAVDNLITELSLITPVGDDLFAFKDANGTSGKVSLTNLAAALQTAGGYTKIQTGSYVGTGTYGASNPCSLTFDFEPKIFFMWEVILYTSREGGVNPLRYAPPMPLTLSTYSTDSANTFCSTTQSGRVTNAVGDGSTMPFTCSFLESYQDPDVTGFGTKATYALGGVRMMSKFSNNTLSWYFDVYNLDISALYGDTVSGSRNVLPFAEWQWNGSGIKYIYLAIG